MAINLKLPDLPKIGKKDSNKLSRGKIPTKNHINTLIQRKQSFSVRKSLPLLILAALLVILLGKFFVIDRLAATIGESNRVATMQAELIEANKQIDALQGIEDEYAHYTTADMTEEELSRVDRVAAMKLVNSAFRGGNVSRSWNLTGNTMTLQVSGPSLSELNLLASELETNAIVERCVISSADKGRDEDGNVSVTFVIYLQKYGQNEE